MNFRSRDLLNVIFEKTSITPFFLLAKDFKSKLKLSRMLLLKSGNFCEETGKKVLNTVTMVVAKILTCYISVTVPDRPMITIIYR